MATRCQIIVEGLDENKIYKHWDGYPEGVMPVLKEVVHRFKEERGWDNEYLLAQIVRFFAYNDNENRQNILDSVEYSNRLKDSYKKPSILGWGISNLWHSDIEYMYMVTKDWHIRIYKPNREFWNDPGLHNLELSKSVDI